MIRTAHIFLMVFILMSSGVFLFRLEAEENVPQGGSDRNGIGAPQGGSDRNEIGAPQGGSDRNEIGARKAGGVSFAVPDGWQEVPPTSAMRLYQFQIPSFSQNMESGELSVFYFEGQAMGGVEANVLRWKNQFAAFRENFSPQINQQTIGSLKVTTVHLEGVFQSGMPGEAPVAKPDYGLLGAIVEGAQGLVFFKMTGPRQTLESVKPAFDAMVAGFK